MPTLHEISKTGTRIYIREFTDERYDLYVVARSFRQANKLAEELEWQTFYGGVGRQFGNLHYSLHKKRLTFSIGHDT